jgi:hypothetical protein
MPFLPKVLVVAVELVQHREASYPSAVAVTGAALVVM